MIETAALIWKIGRHKGHRREAPPAANKATQRCAEGQSDGPKRQHDNAEGLSQEIPPSAQGYSVASVINPQRTPNRSTSDTISALYVVLRIG